MDVRMDVGSTLRRAREARGLSVRQVAAITKIPAGVLQAIDEGAYDRVPRGIFARGFIRAYAREVGLDAEEMVARFREETAEPVPAVPGAESSSDAVIEEEIGQLRIDPDLSGSRPGWGYALIVAALIIGIVSFNRSSEPEALPTTPQTVSGTTSETAIEPSAAINQAAGEVDAVATTGGPLRFEIQAQGECWVKAVVDGRTVVSRLLQAGERVTADVQHDVVLRVGNPAALTYSINGGPAAVLGSAGMPITVRFTSDGRKAPLAS